MTDKKKASYYLPDDLCRDVEALAVERRCRPNRVVEDALRRYVRRAQRKAAQAKPA